MTKVTPSTIEIHFTLLNTNTIRFGIGFYTIPFSLLKSSILTMTRLHMVFMTNCQDVHILQF